MLTELDVNRDNTPSGDGWATMKVILAKSPYGAVKTRKLINDVITDGSYECHIGTELGNRGVCRQVWYRKKIR